MLVYFDRNGVVKETLTYGFAARAGTTAFKIIAIFEDMTSTDGIEALIKLYKPDLYKSSYPLLLMNATTIKFDSNLGTSSYLVNGQTYPAFEFDFNYNGMGKEVILLDTPGLWRSVITLVGSSYNVQGSVTFEVESGNYPEEGTQIGLDQIMFNITQQLGLKLDDNSDLYPRVVNSEDISELNVLDYTNYDGSGFFAEGCIIFTRDTYMFYILNNINTGALTKIPVQLDLTGYATENWVLGRGYVTSSALDGYATQDWVTSQGYITSYTDTNYYHSPSYDSGLKIGTGTGIGDLYVPYAAVGQRGVVKLGSGTVQIQSTNSPESIAGRVYPVQNNSNGEMVVCVPSGGSGNMISKHVYKYKGTTDASGITTFTYSFIGSLSGSVAQNLNTSYETDIMLKAITTGYSADTPVATITLQNGQNGSQTFSPTINKAVSGSCYLSIHIRRKRNGLQASYSNTESLIVYEIMTTVVQNNAVEWSESMVWTMSAIPGSNMQTDNDNIFISIANSTLYPQPGSNTRSAYCDAGTISTDPDFSHSLT